MAIIPKETVEQVLQATDIVELIQSYVPLKRAGAQYRANCPFHNEKTPSFYVNPARQSFKCFGCGKGGDSITFVREYENLPFGDAIRRLAQRGGIQIREEIEDPEVEKNRRSKGKLLDLHREVTAFFHEQLMKSPQASHAREYIRSRGYGAAMAKSWMLGWMPDDSSVFLDWARGKGFTGSDLVRSGICNLREEGKPRSGLWVRFRDRLMFPVRNEIGDVIAFSGRQLNTDPRTGKYINSPETSLFLKSRVLYALDRAKKPILNEKCALLCEGQLDVIACHEAGVGHAIAPLGTSFTEDHARLLKRYTSHVVGCYDADKAGVAASERLFRVISPHGLSMRVACLPEGLDPDDFIRTRGVDAFRAVLSEAKEFFDFKLEYARKVGLMADPASRNQLFRECAEILAGMVEMAARENGVNTVSAQLGISAHALREEIAKIKSRSRRSYPEPQAEVSEVLATPIHRVVGYLCHLALRSPEAQYFLADQFEVLHEASRWLEGMPLLEAILTQAPDASSAAAVNAYLASLEDADRLALMAFDDEVPANGLQVAEESMALLSGIVLQKRDAAVKASLKEPGLSSERMCELFAELKEITSLLEGIGQRHEFSDELPKSTYKPRVEWKVNWRDRKKPGEST